MSRVHYLTSLDLHRDGQDVTANCGKLIEKAAAVEVLEPGSDRAIVTSLRDCRRCVAKGDALVGSHYFSRIVSAHGVCVETLAEKVLSNEASRASKKYEAKRDKRRYLGRSGE